jgi:hypothetical protein
VTVRFETGINAKTFLMDMPGGVVSRPNERVFSPTFWPFQHFLHLRSPVTGRGLAFYQNLPGAVSLAADGTLQAVALRNAPRERAYHFFPLSGNPAKGYERDAYSFVYGIEFTGGGDWIDNRLAEKAYSGNLNPWSDSKLTKLHRLAEELIAIDRSDVWVLANKPARRGTGRVVRLYALAGVQETATLESTQSEILEAFLCDARERNIRRLEVREGAVRVPLVGTMTSVRLLTEGRKGTE